MTFPIEGKCPVCGEFPCTNLKVCWDNIILHERIAALEAEVHRARTDSKYWSEFNTVTIDGHDAYRTKVQRLAKLSRAATCWVHNKIERDRLLKAIEEVENE